MLGRTAANIGINQPLDISRIHCWFQISTADHIKIQICQVSNHNLSQPWMQTRNQSGKFLPSGSMWLCIDRAPRYCSAPCPDHKCNCSTPVNSLKINWAGTENWRFVIGDRNVSTPWSNVLEHLAQGVCSKKVKLTKGKKNKPAMFSSQKHIYSLWICSL